MKIFALNLSLEFISKSQNHNYAFECISLEELMGELFKGSNFKQQKLYVEAADSEEFISHVFDIQKNELWRDLELSICFVFKSQDQLENFWDHFQDLFKHVDAAGGLVENEKGEYLMIFNRNKWTLPKGHVEWQEPIEEAAIREVKEETGIKEVHIMKKMPPTYHTFRKKRKWILKTTYWYNMQASSKEELIAEAEENIEDVKWMSKEDWLKVADSSYPLTRDLFVQEFTKSLI
ncbi:MAG: NUDIX domain-containing protein [Bacteroidota bacterium]